jgi:hypothetical protein
VAARSSSGGAVKLLAAKSPAGSNQARAVSFIQHTLKLALPTCMHGLLNYLASYGILTCIATQGLCGKANHLV